jgi:hypothetical protein
MRNSDGQVVLISTATATHAPLIPLGLDLGQIFVPSGSLINAPLTATRHLTLQLRSLLKVTGRLDVGRYQLNVKSGLTSAKKQVNRIIIMGP